MAMLLQTLLLLAVALLCQHAAADGAPADEPLKITYLETSGRVQKTSFTLRWGSPAGSDSREEKWTYGVETTYIQNGRITRRSYPNVTLGSGMGYRTTLRELNPCTTYQVRVTGTSQRYAPRVSRSTPRTLLPGVYRRAVSSPLVVSTVKSEPLERVNVDDILLEKSKVNSNNCTLKIRWTPKVQPFGCRTMGFYVRYVTPTSWPRKLQVKGTGTNVTVSGLVDQQAYIFTLMPYNQFGTGRTSNLVFVEFGGTDSLASPPTDLNVTSRTCLGFRLTWRPPVGLTTVRVTKYEAQVHSGNRGYSTLKTVIPSSSDADYTFNEYFGYDINNQVGAQKTEVQVVAYTDWGAGEPAIFPLAVPDSLPGPPTALNVTYRMCRGFRLKWRPPAGLTARVNYYWVRVHSGNLTNSKHVYNSPCDQAYITEVFDFARIYRNQIGSQKIEVQVVAHTNWGAGVPANLTVALPERCQKPRIQPNDA